MRKEDANVLFRVALPMLGLCIFAASASAQGQGRCNINTITGTYAFSSLGSSMFIASRSSEFPPNWNALYAPVAIVGTFTVKPDRTAEGQYWAIVGTINLGTEATPWTGRIAELNEDCTGVLEYDVSWGGFSGRNRERFFVIENGRELRTVAEATAVPTATWFTTAHRIANGGVARCGPNTSRGVYVVRCAGLLPPGAPPDTLVGVTSMFRIDIGANGEFTGVGYSKGGPGFRDLPPEGSVTVHPDCTSDMTLRSPVLGPIERFGKGVFFDEGRQIYFLPLVTLVPDAGLSIPLEYDFCTATRVDR